MCHGAPNLYRAAHICANLQWNAAEPTEPSPQSLCAMCKVQSARVKSRLIFGKAGQHKISLLSASPPWWQRSKSTLKSRIGGSVGLIEISLMRKIPQTLSLIVSGSLPWGPAQCAHKICLRRLTNLDSVVEHHKYAGLTTFSFKV